VLERLGEKRAEEGAYVWQKLMKSGAMVTNGTDSPVEDVSPVADFYSKDDIKGTLTPGKLADITVLSRDIMTIPEDEILGTEVVYTIVGGKIVYSGSGAE
jgi:hypothetical protein